MVSEFAVAILQGIGPTRTWKDKIAYRIDIHGPL